MALTPSLLPMLALCAAALVVRAQEPESPPEPPPPPPPKTEWEGAIGLTASYRPEYSGADKQITKLTPALFLRYGRFTITNASGFVTRRADDVVRGLGLDMVRSDRVRLNISLRFDRGRSEGSSEALAGLGDIRQTVRVRTAASWRLDGPWRLGASWSFDLLGRGGGNLGDVSGGWEHKLAPHTTLGVGATLALAGDRYLQSYYGISEEQAARSGYPVYTPKAGLRDVAVSANLRHDFNADWIGLAGIGAARLLGPAAASPLTTRRDSWSISAGLARRF
jgi:MipA family protein